MKSILLFFIITLFTTTLFAQIDERKTDVYFANGILTESIGADNNAILLEKAIRNETYAGNITEYEKHIAKVTTAYNSTHGFLPDGIETFFQKFGWTALNDLFSAHGADLSKQVDKYRDSISSRHSVLVVAHSQGNLFTKEAYDALSPCMQARFEAISVASPMKADIKEETPRISWDNDMVPVLLGSGGTTNNNVRKIRWVDTSFDPLNHEEDITAPAINSYTKRSNISGMYEDTVLKATEGGINSKVHAFRFYMGKPLYFDEEKEIPYIDPFTKEPLVDTTAKGKILSTISKALEKLKAPASAPTDVDIDIQLSWESSSLALDLFSELGQREDGSDNCSNKEHFYLESADDVALGTYGV